MVHLRDAGVDFLTIGQYLRPSKRHLKVMEYMSPWESLTSTDRMGEDMGFRYVASGPAGQKQLQGG